MSNLVPVADRPCVQCGVSFTPKVGGYNARYCRDRCKRRSQLARLRASNPESIKIRRSRSYANTKGHTVRYERHLDSVRSAREVVRDWLGQYKLKSGCVDCGYNVHFAALQLDHEGPKAVEIAHARSSLRRLKAEIVSGQCKVRCANCHSIKTWERKQPGGNEIGKGCGE